MVSKDQMEKTFDDIDDIDVKPKRGGKKNKENSNKSKKNLDGASKIDVMALINNDEEEERSEVMSIRITPSSRKKIEQIWLDQRKKRKKIKESTIAAEILMKVLDQY